MAEVVVPWHAFLDDVFDRRHSADLGKAFYAVRAPSSAQLSVSTCLAKVSRMLNDDRSRPAAHNVWALAEAARATGVKWFAGPLALLAAGHIADFVLVMAAARNAGIGKKRFQDLSYSAPAACGWSHVSSEEIEAERTARHYEFLYAGNPHNKRAMLVAANASNRKLRVARRTRMKRCRDGDLPADRRIWKCSAKEHAAFAVAWQNRHGYATDNVLTAACLVEKHPVLGRRKQQEVAVSVLAVSL